MPDLRCVQNSIEIAILDLGVTQNNPVKQKYTIFVFLVVDWNKLTMEAHAGEYH